MKEKVPVKSIFIVSTEHPFYSIHSEKLNRKLKGIFFGKINANNFEKYQLCDNTSQPILSSNLNLK